MSETLLPEVRNDVTLETCEREPIHIPGAIQPHGLLLALEEPSLNVVHVSSNVAAFFGAEPSAVLGTPLTDWVDDKSQERLRARVGLGELREANPFPLVTRGGRMLEAAAHRSGSHLVVECEPAVDDGPVVVGFDARLRASVLRMQRATNVRDLSQLAAEEVRRLTGFDRVMVYRFDEAWNGEVVAECKRDDLAPFLGTHYPASDIPAQARRLYTLSWLRFIADVDYQPTPIVPTLDPKTQAPLDMSHAFLRSVSPIHIEYLKNMKVSASMSVSLVIDGELAGLIACHHYSGPRLVPATVRDTCEYLAYTLSWQLRVLESAERAEHARQSQEHEAEVVRSIALASELLDGLDTPALLQLTGAQGAAVVLAEGTRRIGETPTNELVHQLVGWLQSEKHEVWSTDDLARDFPQAKAEPERWQKCAGGVVAVAISRDIGEYIVWFRPAVAQDVKWAGDPRKKVIVQEEGKAPRLSPRGSFELWIETIEGRSLPWEKWQVDAASSLRRVILGGVRRRAVQLRTINERLLEADRAKDDFLATVSHELRTPLNAISGWTTLLRRGDVDAGRLNHALDVIARNVQTQLQLVEDLLDVSRITSGKLVLDIDYVDLDGVVQSTIDSSALALQAKGLAVETVLEPGIGKIRGDAVRLRQIVGNLITNAVKFTPKGGHITVRLHKVESDVELVVSDTGMGIDGAFLPHVFEAFRQADSAMNRRSQGLGLGLAIVKKLVELHGGKILVESPGLGMGATFRVTLPVTPFLVGDRTSPMPAEQSEPASILANLHILCVEDDNDSRELVRHILERNQAQVTTAASAKAALALLETGKFDVIVSDVGMPEMDGLTMMRTLRANRSSTSRATPAVALTAYTRALDRTAALTAGFQAHVPKPVDPEELVLVIRSILDRPSSS